jgi:sulfonate transport system substrate-binding protein
MRARAISVLLVIVAFTLFVSAGSPESEAPSEINISYVKSPFNLPIMIMRSQGMLDEAFAADGIEIRWHDITSGARQAEAMAAGSLDVASVINSTSVVLANAAGNTVYIAGAFSRPEQTFGIVTMSDGPSSVAQLRGGRVAGPKGTVLHQILVAALAAEGMTEADVEFFSMGLPEARTALLAGEVDAALLAASLIIRTQEAGGQVIATAEGNAVPKLVVGVRPAFLENYPELVDRYLAVQEEAMRFIAENVDEALRIGAEEHGITLDDARTLYQWADFTMTLTRDDISSMREDVSFLLEQGMIDSAVEPDDFVLETAVE